MILQTSLIGSLILFLVICLSFHAPCFSVLPQYFWAEMARIPYAYIRVELQKGNGFMHALLVNFLCSSKVSVRSVYGICDLHTVFDAYQFLAQLPEVSDCSLVLCGGCQPLLGVNQCLMIPHSLLGSLWKVAVVRQHVVKVLSLPWLQINSCCVQLSRANEHLCLQQ